MTEDFLSYIWRHQLFNKENLKTTNNESLEIILPGIENTDSGPDFFNARIKINSTLWAGNIEIHTDSKNWTLHKHYNNKAYDNVILHVVSNYSEPAVDTTGKEIPTLVLSINKDLISIINKLTTSKNRLPCHEDLPKVNELTRSMWLDRLCIERLETKTEYIKSQLEKNQSNWEESFYVVLSKSFGFNTNAIPFEMLARLTPMRIIAKYSQNIFQLEALLFGQAGFLDEHLSDDYSIQLSKEYLYIKKVHQLKSIEKHLWKFLRLRPNNFPTIRIAQFASFIYHSNRLFSQILETEQIKDLKQLLSCNVSEYWKTHYTFGKMSKEVTKQMGTTAINGIIINTIIPFLFIYGKERGIEKHCSQALKFLDSMPAEKNSIISNWEHNNIHAVNAGQSQALIQLTNFYCSEKKCLYCQIGNTILQYRNL